jgi:hypothetical protein
MSSPSVEEMRVQVNAVYHNARKWTAKTRKMGDMQTLAIWTRLSLAGKLRV